MSRHLTPLTLDALDDLPPRCRSCVYWELDPVAGDRSRAAGDTSFEKEAWLSAVLLQWGSAGRLAYVDDVPAGFVTYAPPSLVPRSMGFPTAPVSADAVLLMTSTVLPRFRGAGLARMLVQGAAKDLTQRGVKAIEAFGVAHPHAPGRDAPPGGCMVPEQFLLAVGFRTVRPHHHYPRLRLELRTALSWREDVEQALERILAGVRAPVPTG